MWISIVYLFQQPGMEVLLDTRVQRKLKSLLLIYLFVVSAAGDCPTPDKGEHFILSQESLFVNEFSEGVEVTLECANGYIKENGSGVITCSEEKWTQPDIICKRKDCGVPGTQPNMNFDMREGSLIGAKIKVTCDKGYRVSGASFKQCFPSGWFGKTKCNIVTCKEPPMVTNGRSSWVAQDNPKYAEVIQYTCNDGYTLIGNHTIVCSETGGYNSQPPQCIGVSTEDRVTKKMVISTPASIQETSTSAVSSTTLPALEDNSVTASTFPTVSPSDPDGRKILTTEDKGATTRVMSATSPSSPDKRDGPANTNSDNGTGPVIISVIVVTLVMCIAVISIRKFYLRRKGRSANGTVPIC
ncbi:complement decay-accelerating factor isoform X2 [Leuresthes tenuis]|uniref:complement decay-accelerating factor isoform X2 n=1 Tax=Leuresthes tenuis TaxID=355514 RepID=UPI003B50CEEC